MSSNIETVLQETRVFPPSAHMRELVRICAIASLAAGDCSRS